jgi:hypothetical protein
MKKIVALLATGTMAVSLYTGAALTQPVGTSFAATLTAESFKDLQNADPALKAKVDAMLAANIFEGVSSDTFGIDQNMTRAQFAKVAVLLYKLPLDTSVTASGFSDVRAEDPANGWAIPYVEAARKAGLIDGVTDTTFAPGEQVTAGQLDAILLRGLGKSVNTTGAVWYADAVKQAGELGFHPAGKAGDAAANRADLVNSSYTVKQLVDKPVTPPVAAPVSVVSAQPASDNLKVQVTFDAAVDTAKATLSLNKGTAAVSVETQWSSDKKTATLTAGSALTAGDYTVTLGGLEASQIKKATATFKIDVPATSGSVSAGGYTYNLSQMYELANVIDSGLTEAATGSSGLDTKANAENPTVSKFAKEIKIKVTNSGGEEVAAPGLVQSITSSDVSVVRTGVSTDSRGYVLGVKPGTATVTVLFKAVNGDTKMIQTTVTVKGDHVASQAIKAEKTSYEHNLANSTQFDAYEAMDLVVTDNYSIKYEKGEAKKYNFALGTLFIVSDIEGGSVTVGQDGTVSMSGSVTSFELSAVLPNGERATTYVTVN